MVIQYIVFRWRIKRQKSMMAFLTEKVNTQMILVFKNASMSGNPMRLCAILLLCSLYVPSIYAEVDSEIQQLQQRASFAYNEMMKAKKKADYLAKDAAFAEKELEAAKKRLADIEQDTEIARQKSAEANRTLERMTNQWQEASDQLDRAWLQSGRK